MKIDGAQGHSMAKEANCSVFEAKKCFAVCFKGKPNKKVGTPVLTHVQLGVAKTHAPPLLGWFQKKPNGLRQLSRIPRATLTKLLVWTWGLAGR